MRSRNIKSDFFSNEQLVELPFEARLLFIGLWMVADREGRLESRPKKIKMDIFPADDVNVKQLLVDLENSGFITSYNCYGTDIIQVTNFVKHQSPHGTEKDSVLPDANGVYTCYERNQKNNYVVGKPFYLNRDDWLKFTGMGEKLFNKKQVVSLSQVIKQDVNGYRTNNTLSDNALNPDSLNPESLNNTCPSDDEQKQGQEVLQRDFEKFWNAYPKKQQKKPAFDKFKKINFKKYPLEIILSALEKQKGSSQWQKENGQFIPMATTWIYQERWNDQIELPQNTQAPVNTSNQIDPSQYVLGEDRRYD
ncbi:hypothetical protein [Acinetobacter haemolyticus]|uniref:hypothetical protein n=1 Tax=Acinetobacter haemolyticus TaxID=29430 RepID=UPI003AF8D16F